MVLKLPFSNPHAKFHRDWITGYGPRLLLKITTFIDFFDCFRKKIFSNMNDIDTLYKIHLWLSTDHFL